MPAARASAPASGLHASSATPAATRALELELAAQQRAGIIGDAPQPCVDLLPTFAVGRTFRLRFRARLAGLPRVAIALLHRLAHALALRGIGGLLPGAILGLRIAGRLATRRLAVVPPGIGLFASVLRIVPGLPVLPLVILPRVALLLAALLLSIRPRVALLLPALRLILLLALAIALPGLLLATRRWLLHRPQHRIAIR